MSGYSGESGHSGMSGESGVSGTSGYSGVSGISGYSGVSGVSGFSGASGVSGFSGLSGFSGTALAAGAVYFLHAEDNDAIPTRRELIQLGSDTAATELTATPSDGNDVLLDEWATNEGEPGTSVWFAGEYRLDASAKVEVVDGTTHLYWKIYRRTGINPGDITLVGTSSLSNPLTASWADYGIQYQLAQEVEVSTSDRLEIQVWARKVGGTGSSTVKLGIEGIAGDSTDHNTHLHTGVVGAFGTSGKSGTSGYSGHSGFSGISGFSGATGTGIVERQVEITYSSLSALSPATVQLGRLVTLEFAAATDNATDFTFEIPDDLDPDRDVQVNLVYHMGSAGTPGTVRMELTYEVVANGGNTVPGGGTTVVQELVPGASDLKFEVDFTIPESVFSATTESIRFTLMRNADHANDTDTRVLRAENLAVRYTGFGAPVQNMGLSGISGFSGGGGQSGTSGYSGTTGSNGTTGDSGTSGYSGLIGVSGFSGTAGGGSSSKTVEAVASTPHTITSGETGKVFTNEGASALIVHTLPTPAAGLQYEFVVQDADGIKVQAATPASQTITLAPDTTGATGYIQSTTIGSTVTLIAINTTQWFALSSKGTWTVA